MNRLSERVKVILPWAVLAGIILLLTAADPTALTVQGPRTPGLPLPIYTLPPGGTSSVQVDVSGQANGSNAAQTVTLPASGGKQVYLTGITVTGLGATAATAVQLTVSGPLNGTLHYLVPVPAGVLVGITPLVLTFNPPIPNDGIGDPITVTLGAFGTGNTSEYLVVTGYQQ